MQNEQNIHFIRATTRCPCSGDGPVLIRVFSEHGVHYGIGVYKYSMADLSDSNKDMHLFNMGVGEMTFYSHELEYVLINQIGGEQ